MTVAGKKRKIFDNKYEILSIAGRGRRSVVYHAIFEGREGDDVALKVLIDVPGLEPPKKRLRDEAHAMINCQHPYVIRLNDFHTVNDLCYLALEYAPLGDLRSYASQLPDNRLPGEKGEKWFRQIVEALHFCHSVGFIHRDVKPENILLVNEEEVRLGDFSIATMVDSAEAVRGLQMAVGTMTYLAPEVLEGSSFGPQADMYALALSFYELLAGTHPFGNGSLARQLEVRHEPLINIRDIASGISSYFAEAIMRSLHPDPKQRFVTMREIVDLLTLSNATQDEEDHEDSSSSEIANDNYSDDDYSGGPDRERYPLTQKSSIPSVELTTIDEILTDETNSIIPEEETLIENELTNDKPLIEKLLSSESVHELDSTQLIPKEELQQIHNIQSTNSVNISRNSPTITIPKEYLKFIENLKRKFPPLTPRIRRGLVGGTLFGLMLIVYGLSSGNKKADIETKLPQLALTSQTKLSWPALPTGLYSGSMSGIIPNETIPLAFLVDEQGVIFVIAGIEGWSPARAVTLNPELNNALSTSSNGFVLQFTPVEQSGSTILGHVKNQITQESGQWVLKREDS